MSPKPWLAEYPPGVPAEIDLNQYASLVDLFEASVRRYGHQPAFTSRGTTLSFRRAEVLSRRLAAYLQSLPDLAPGDRVAVMLPNLLQCPIAVFAVLRAGFTVVNVNPQYTARELEHQLRDSGAKAIVVLENFAATVMQVLAKTQIAHVLVSSAGDLFPLPARLVTNFFVRHVKQQVPSWKIPGAIRLRRALGRGRWHTFKHVAAAADAPAFLQYTGGTTGIAKGAQLTHANMVANALQAAAWVKPLVTADAGVVVTPLPLYHVYSLTANLLCFFELGVHNLLIADPRDLPGFVKELARHRFSFLTAVNTLFNALLATPGFEKLDFSALRVAMGGGMAVHRDVATRWFAATGVSIAQGYGLTEASPILTASPLDAKIFSGSVGLPMPSTEVGIFDADGERLGTGEIGEICARGPQVMAGYWHQPEETAKAFFPEGWLRTGDIGRLDERGYLFIEDRLKDMIVVSGFNVFPNEVEDVASTHPGIREAAAIGVEDARTGEAVKLFVVRDDPTLTAEDVIEHCRKELTGYKVPHFIEFIDELPKSNVGKVLRRELKARDKASNGAAAQAGKVAK